MLALAHGFAIQHGIAEHVQVELDLRGGLPAFSVIGLAAGSARDARERVQAAVVNSGLTFPRQRVTVNLAPASQRRGGAQFDLAIACSVLAAQGEINAERLTRVGLYAELGLGGQLRPCPFVAVAAEAAAQAGLRGLIVASEDLAEARQFAGVQVLGRDALREVAELLAGPGPDRAGGQRRNGSAAARTNRSAVPTRNAGAPAPPSALRAAPVRPGSRRRLDAASEPVRGRPP
ncbi:MAG: magnesium chelatase domain-containing protein [Solirubrobacteraceae bacterium]